MNRHIKAWWIQKGLGNKNELASTKGPPMLHQEGSNSQREPGKEIMYKTTGRKLFWNPRNNPKRKLPRVPLPLDTRYQHNLDVRATMSSFSNLGPFLWLMPLSLKGWQRKFMSPFVLVLCRETNQYDTILFYWGLLKWLWMLKSLKFLGQTGSLEIQLRVDVAVLNLNSTGRGR